MLGINNRGSSGYGKTFFAADDQKHGREPLWDCVDAKQYLQSLGYVDPERIGIIGGSYGGYMVLAALAFQPQEFKVGVDMFGVANWIRTLESIPSWWEAQRTALYTELGDPVKDRKMLGDVSPLLHADLIRKPLLVLQGANDPRVLQVGVGRDRRGGEEERRRRRVHRVCRRGARVHEEGEPDCRLQRRAQVPGSVSQGGECSDFYLGCCGGVAGGVVAGGVVREQWSSPVE